jgi:hypothetical protein
MERAMLRTDRRYPLSVVVALRLAPAVPESALRQALHDLQHRHGALSARIDGAGRSPAFAADRDAGAVPLEVGPGHTSWVDLCTERLNGRVPADRAPLMDVALLEERTGEASRVVVRFHHALVDGWVVGRLLTDLLGLLASSGAAPRGAGEGLEIRALDRSAFRSSPVERLGFLVRELRADRAFTRSTRGHARAPVPAGGPCRAHARALTVEQTRALTRACRVGRATVQAAITAAMLRATLRRFYREADRPMRAISFADLRASLPSPCARSVGAHVGMLRHVFEVDVERPLGDLAEACTGAVAESMRRGEARTAAALSPLAMGHVLRRGTERMADTALSYLGPIELPERVRSWTVTDVHAFISSNPLGPILSGFGHLFGRRLSLGFMTMAGDMDGERADALVDDVVQDLVTFAGR